MAVKGRWEGKLVDATGVNAVIEMSLADRNGRLTGDFATYFIAEDQGCKGAARRLTQTGEVSGRYSAKNGTVTLTYEVTVGLKPTKVRLDGRVTEAGNHARQAIVGCYTADGEESMTLKGGGVVLWQYVGR